MAITAEEQTSIVQLVVGMAGVAPRPEDLADLVAEFEAGSSLVQIAQNIVDHPAYSGDSGLFPAYLPNAVWADQYLTMLIGDDVSAEDLAAAIAAITADLNAGSTRAEVAVATIDGLAAETPAAGYEDAAATLANQTTVAEYYAVTSVAEDASITAMTAAIADVDSTAGSVTAGIAAVDAALPVVPFDLAAGVTAIDTATAAIAAFLTAESTDAAAIAAAVTAAEGAYDTAVNNVVAASSAYATDSDATIAAALAAASGIAAADLADAQAVLATASGGITAIAGLTEAIAANDAADDAVTAATAAAATTLIASNAASASWVVNSDAGAEVDTSTDTAGVLTIAVNDVGNDPFTDNTVLTLTAVSGTTGLASLADPVGGWTAGQIAVFDALQAGTGVAEFMAAFNANVVADDTVTTLTTAAAATKYSMDFLDLDAGSKVELTAIGNGFTLTTDPADPAKTTEAEVAGETAAHLATVTALDAVEVATTAAKGAATTADNTADTAVTDFGTLVTNYDAAVLANAANTNVVDTYALLTAWDGVRFPVIGGNSQAEIIAADVGTVQPQVVLENAALAAIATSTQAALDLATTTDNAAITAAANALTASNTFAGLVTDLDTGITVNPAIAAIAGPQGDVDAAEVFTDDIADAVTGLADAQTDEAALAVLTDALTDANDAFGDNGYSTPNAIDATAEFGTALDDIFIAGTLDSDVYNFSLQGDDILSIGDVVLNTTDIGAGAGQTALADAGDVLALEVFLVDTGTNVDVVIETENYGSETGDYTTITLIGVASVDDVAVSADGLVTLV